MKLPLFPLAALAAALLLPACDEQEPARELSYDEQLEKTYHDEQYRRDRAARDERRAARKEGREEESGDINATGWYGCTRLANVSQRLNHALDRLEDAIRSEDAEEVALERKYVAELKAKVRELLRAGADPWARSVSQRDGKLAACAIQYWPADFIEELRKDGFNISDTPTP